MYGVLVEVTPSGCKNMEAVKFEGHPGRYGRYEVIKDYPADDVLRQFDRDTFRRERRMPFMDFSPNNPAIKKVIFNDPATIVIWKDGTKTVVKCQPGDTYDKELGLALCISKKYFGNKGNFNEVFKKWIPEEDKKEIVTAYDDNGNVVKEIIKEALSIEDMKHSIRMYCSGRPCEDCVICNTFDRKPGHCTVKATDYEVIENYNAIKDLI